jgi:hypothetical protein
VKNRAPASTHKKVVIVLLDHTPLRGYLDPTQIGTGSTLDILSPEGEHVSLLLSNVKSVHFVREFTDSLELERKAFLSRPKLDGLWVRLRFRDNETLEGVVPNDLLALLDHGVQITPPDLHGNSLRIFIPRTALAEMTVLGVVGVARRTPRRAPAEVAPQRKLFTE